MSEQQAPVAVRTAGSERRERGPGPALGTPRPPFFTPISIPTLLRIVTWTTPAMPSMS